LSLKNYSDSIKKKRAEDRCGYQGKKRPLHTERIKRFMGLESTMGPSMSAVKSEGGGGTQRCGEGEKGSLTIKKFIEKTFDNQRGGSRFF